jgi:hypothetical protein
MNPDDAQFRKKLATTLRGFRWLGLVFFALSSMFAAFFIYCAFDPSVPFRINGVESHDTGHRVRAAAFSAVIPLFASFFAFCPRALLEKLLRHQFSEMEKMKKRLGLMK